MSARLLAAGGSAVFGLVLCASASGRGEQEEQKAKIVFMSTRGGERDLYALDPGDGRIARLTEGSAATDDVVVSRDGSRVAFEGRAGIEVVGSDGRGRKHVPQCPLPTVSFSPDGRRLVCKAQDGAIVLIDLDGSEIRRLAWSGSDPEWSPDGRLIAFIEDEGLMVVDREGGRARLLTPRRPYRVAWSPDSSRLALEDREGLFLVNADRSGERRLLRGDTNGAAWSPVDGRALAVTLGDPGTVVLVDTATGAAKRLVRASSRASWSPLGRWIVVERPRAAGEDDADLYVVRPDGSGLHALTGPFPDGGSNGLPTWVPGPVVDGAPRTATRVARLRPARELAFTFPFNAASEIAAETSRVAVAGCTLWDTRVRRTLKPRACRGSAHAVALSGTRLAWLHNWCSCNLEGYVDVRFADPPYRRMNQAAFTAALNESGDGEQASNLMGDGSLLAFNVNMYRGGGKLFGRQLWTIPQRTRGRRQRCPESKSGLDNSSGAGRFCMRVRSGDGAALLDVDRGRILALRDEGPLLLIRGDGRLLRRWPFAPGEVKGAAVSGSTIALATVEQLRVYEARSGALRDSWRLPRGFAAPRVEDVFGGFSVYSRGGAVHLVRLRDGRAVALHVAQQSADVHARLERPGLFYLYNKMGARKPGRIAFVPRTRLPALVAGGRPLAKAVTLGSR